MSVVGLVAGALGGLVVGALAGLALGSRFAGRTWRFWALVALLFVACVVLATRALELGMEWLATAAVGILAGGLTGLKYGTDDGLRRLMRPPR